MKNIYPHLNRIGNGYGRSNNIKPFSALISQYETAVVGPTILGFKRYDCSIQDTIVS